jgi:hypothetical protein
MTASPMPDSLRDSQRTGQAASNSPEGNEAIT